jgi:hypothetical protein
VYFATGELARNRCRPNVLMNNGKKINAVESGDVIAVRPAEAERVDVVVRGETQPVENVRGYYYSVYITNWLG